MIDKVIMSLQKPDSMEQINSITDLHFDATDNWVDLQTFEEKTELKKFITDKEFNALKNKDADYIVFRIDY